MIPLIKGPRVGKFIKTENRMVVAGGWGRRGGELLSTVIRSHKMKKFW